MNSRLRIAGAPSPLADRTHDDGDLPPAFPFEEAAAGTPEITLAEGAPSPGDAGADPFDLGAAAGMPPWLVQATRMIRPICVGALMAIPTLGAATVGTVAIVDQQAAMHAVAASTAFLAGIPGDITLLIGALATGYSLSKTVERIRGVRR